MKKFFLTVLIFALIPLYACAAKAAAVSCATAADAAAEAEAALLGHENVSDAVVIIIGDNCVAGVRTKGIVLKSRKDELFKSVSAWFAEHLPEVRKIFVTLALSEIMFLKDAKQRLADGGAALEIYDEILSRTGRNYFCFDLNP